MSEFTHYLPVDPASVREALTQLLSRREAEKLVGECGGSATQLLQLARVRGGRA